MNLTRSLALAILLFLGLARLHATEITVYAAASLSEVFKELAPRFASASGHTLRFNFGASGLLARQLKEGAPADAFFSADELRLDQLDKAGLLRPGTRQVFLLNTLVLIAPKPAPVELSTLTDLTKPALRHIAIGEPATVPVGSYTRELLQGEKLWDSLQPKLVPLDNVRSVLAAVESGNAEAGFVYKTDALLSKKVQLCLEVPADKSPAIRYPGAVLRDATQPEAAKAFLVWLKSPEARALFASHGFLSAN